MRLSLLLGLWGHASHIDWTWSEFLDLGDELVCEGGKSGPFACTQIEHPDSTPTNIDFIQYTVDTLHPRPCPEITVYEMTVALQAAHDHDTVRAVFKGLEKE
jgi:hypothetical protein